MFITLTYLGGKFHKDSAEIRQINKKWCSSLIFFLFPVLKLVLSAAVSCLVLPYVVITTEAQIQPNTRDPPDAPSTVIQNIYLPWPLSRHGMFMLLLLRTKSLVFKQHREAAAKLTFKARAWCRPEPFTHLGREKHSVLDAELAELQAQAANTHVIHRWQLRRKNWCSVVLMLFMLMFSLLDNWLR